MLRTQRRFRAPERPLRKRKCPPGFSGVQHEQGQVAHAVGRAGNCPAPTIDAITGPSAGVRAALDLLLPALVDRETGELAALMDECEVRLPGYASSDPHRFEDRPIARADE